MARNAGKLNVGQNVGGKRAEEKLGRHPNKEGRLSEKYHKGFFFFVAR